MKQLSGKYTVKFPAIPKFQAMMYDGYDVKARTTVVLKWKIVITQSSKGKYMFEPTRGKETSTIRFKE